MKGLRGRFFSEQWSIGGRAFSLLSSSSTMCCVLNQEWKINTLLNFWAILAIKSHVEFDNARKVEPLLNDMKNKKDNTRTRCLFRLRISFKGSSRLFWGCWICHFYRRDIRKVVCLPEPFSNPRAARASSQRMFTCLIPCQHSTLLIIE